MARLPYVTCEKLKLMRYLQFGTCRRTYHNVVYDIHFSVVCYARFLCVVRYQFASLSIYRINFMLKMFLKFRKCLERSCKSMSADPSMVPIYRVIREVQNVCNLLLFYRILYSEYERIGETFLYYEIYEVADSDLYFNKKDFFKMSLKKSNI